MTSNRLQREARGMALLPIILLIAVLSVVAAFAIKVSGAERAQAGKSVHNVSMQTMTDTSLQYARNFFANNYCSSNRWGNYLSYFAANPVKLASRSELATYIANLKTMQPQLVVPLPDYLANDYDCFIYAQDNVDEFPPVPNDPSTDNDLLIYVGAVCAQKNQGGSTQSEQLIAELTAPLLGTFSPPKDGNPANLNQATSLCSSQ
jgi:hypothetical protein